MREAHELREPTEQYAAQPLDDNLFEWHFTLRGPVDSEFDGGLYHGRIILPTEYPMKPPSIMLLTPNGRFEINKKICLSISGYHPESWQPSWSIRTALLAIIGFMPTHSNGAIGALEYTAEERQILARRSIDWQCPHCGSITHILKPVTDASQADRQEARQLASQISFQGEKEPLTEVKSPEESVPILTAGQPSVPPRWPAYANMNNQISPTRFPQMLPAGATRFPMMPHMAWPPTFMGAPPGLVWPPFIPPHPMLQRPFLPVTGHLGHMPVAAPTSRVPSSESTATVSRFAIVNSVAAPLSSMPDTEIRSTSSSSVISLNTVSSPATPTTPSDPPTPTATLASPAETSVTNVSSVNPIANQATTAITHPSSPIMRQRHVPRVSTTRQVAAIPRERQGENPIILFIIGFLGVAISLLIIRRLIMTIY